MTESQKGDPHRAVADEIGTFLTVMATELREIARRLQATVDRITEIAALRSGETDREFVIALQDFDRLNQEFTAIATVLGEVASRSGEKWLRTAVDDHPVKDVIAGISLADLKERLLRHISMSDLLALPATDEVVF